jgi:hypothetical protein
MDVGIVNKLAQQYNEAIHLKFSIKAQNKIKVQHEFYKFVFQ